MGLYLSVLEVLIDSLGVVRLWCTNILYLLGTFRFYNLLYRCMCYLVLELR